MESLWNIKTHHLCYCNPPVLSPITPQHGAAISYDLAVTSSLQEASSIISIKREQLLEPQIISIFSLFCLVSLHICDPQWLQHQYQTAQALFFQLSAETSASSFLLTIPALPASLQGNSTKQNPILNLSWIFLLLLFWHLFSISLLD